MSHRIQLTGKGGGTRAPPLHSMVQTMGGRVFTFVVHATKFDVATGKHVATIHNVIIVSPDFFQSSRIAEFWAQRLALADSEVDPHTLRLSNVEDVFWPYHSRKRQWAPLVKHKMQLFHCSYAKLVPLVRNPSESKEELHHVLIAARTLDEASAAMNQIMVRGDTPTRAKYVKRTKVEAVLTCDDGAVEDTGRDMVDGSLQEESDGEDEDEDEDEGDVECDEESDEEGGKSAGRKAREAGARGGGEEGDVTMVADNAQPPVATTAAAAPTPSSAVLADALRTAIAEAPMGGPRATVTTIVMESDGGGGEAIFPEATAVAGGEGIADDDGVSIAEAWDAVPLPAQPALSVIPEDGMGAGTVIDDDDDEDEDSEDDEDDEDGGGGADADTDAAM